MQPPPRKVKLSQELKHRHSEQINRLHIKHQTECDLLEDLRTYSQKKAIIEKDYAQALHKLATQYLKRDWPGVQSEEQKDYRNVCAVWKAYLEGVVKVTQSRISGCENYRSQVSDPVKTFRAQKEQQLKKCIEQLTRVQTELQDTVKDLTKSRKKYQETEQMAQAVRDKADMEAKSKLSLFQSRSSLKRASVKLKAKRNECNAKATHTRNDYLLTLAAANAHQDRYYETDLINCIKVLDGSMYDHMKGYLMSLCRVELDSAQAVQDTFHFLLEKSSGVLQDFHQQLFIQENIIFQKAPPFQYQPSENDAVVQLQKESGTAEDHSLNKEARKWATRVAREHKTIIHNQKTLSEWESQGLHPQDQTLSELELKVEEAKENIRKAETVKLKAEARLNLLRDVGVTVDTWMKSAMNQVMEELENERWATLNTHDASLSSTADLDREDEEEEETLDDSSSSPSITLRNYPLTCRVLYSYKASQPDELTIEEQEVLEVIDDGDMEDWVKARNRAGQVGYVPEKYLQLPSSNSLLSMLQSLAALETRSHSSSNSTEQEHESEPATASPNGDSTAVTFAKALYDYEAQTEDELSFPEGAIIRILSKDNQEDDGFWEGEFNGRVGVFPAVLVEDLTAPESEDTHRGMDTQVSPSALGPHPPHLAPASQLASQPPCSPVPSPQPSSSNPSPQLRPPSSSASPGLSSHSLNGYHRPAPGPPKHANHRHSHGSTPPPKYPADGAPGTLRPVRAAPPPPKQQAQGQVQKREEVEVTLV
ncbi:F-BAR and double SH3 domains protein 2 [Chanos chanos]|uniref:F-BAR and double SH3 domains protein 2 n=1 Tax=Chanos chanos TaxID=29144 RepID=A0A6J2WW30_CHACN|nr:F-BAR and double SH3 domains protein 2-like [Chanos chanos]